MTFEHCSYDENSKIFTMNWSLFDIYSRRHEILIKSPVYSEGKRKWFLTLTPEDSMGYASVFLHGESKEQLRCLKKVKFSIDDRSHRNFDDRSNKYKEYSSIDFDYQFHDSASVGTKRFVEDLFKKEDNDEFLWLKGYSLVIKCQIIVEKEIEEQQEDSTQKVGKCLAQDLQQMFESKQYADFKIKCGDKVFDCPRILLAARSNVFKAMLETSAEGGGYLESSAGEVTVKDICPEVMDQLVRYVYTDEVEDKALEEMADKLFMAAHKYEMHGLIELCLNSLCKSIDEENACQLLCMARLYNLPNLKAKTLKFIKSSNLEDKVLEEMADKLVQAGCKGEMRGCIDLCLKNLTKQLQIPTPPTEESPNPDL